MNDENRKALIALRVAVARTAQVMEVESMRLPVLGKAYEELHDMAETNEHGWKSLLFKVMMEGVRNESHNS
jgi:hypothetical protein